jgi:GAF domain-containing protein
MAEEMGRQRLAEDRSASLRYAAWGAAFGALFPAVGTVVKVAILGLPLEAASLVRAQIVEPLLWIIDTAPFVLGVMAAFVGRRQESLRRLNHELRQREQELSTARNELAERVERRTFELSESNEQLRQRAAQLQAVSDVARATASLQGLDELLPAMTRLISEQFGYYHVGIFLLDENRETAILRAASSAGGQRLLAQDFKLKVDGGSMVGHAVIFGKARVASQAASDPLYSANPELPETRSEVALPLIAANRTIGVLDAQAREPVDFDQATLDVLATLAYQVAVAIENARLFGETRSALAEAQDAYQQFIGQAWSRFTQSQSLIGYRSDGGRAARITEMVDTPEVISALTTGDVSGGESSAKPGEALAVPVRLRDQVIGVLRIQSKDPTRQWSADDLAIARAAADRAALALENARLLADSQKRASKEKIISEATAHISSALNVENILHTTTNELARALGSADIVLQLSADESE